MPNQAGVVDATPTRKVLHLQYIDSEGKVRTDSYDFPDGTTDAELNALTAAVGDVTNASLFAIGYTNWYATGVAQKSDAVDSTNDSVMDNVVILMKNSTNQSFDFFIPANNEATTMVEDTENVNTTSTEMSALMAALEAIFGGYVAYAARFTERRKKNRSTRI